MTTVSVFSFGFDPDTVTIDVNDSVKWVWTGNGHSSTSTGGLWNSGVHSTGFNFTNKFTSTGNFPYICTAHTFMIGSVTVQGGANVPPSVAITNPANGAVFSAPADVTITATASDGDGAVTNVQFFQGTTSLTNRSSNPFSVMVNGLAAGNYNFSAVASDNLGAKATNAISVSVVTPVAILLSNPLKLMPTQFRFEYTANTGLRYAVQRSSALTNFSPLITNTAAASSVSFTDSAATLDQNYYRVRRLPNP